MLLIQLGFHRRPLLIVYVTYHIYHIVALLNKEQRFIQCLQPEGILQKVFFNMI